MCYLHIHILLQMGSKGRGVLNPEMKYWAGHLGEGQKQHFQ